MAKGYLGWDYIRKVVVRGFAGGITVCYKPAQLPPKNSVKVILKPSRFTSGE